MATKKKTTKKNNKKPAKKVENLNDLTKRKEAEIERVQLKLGSLVDELQELKHSFLLSDDVMALHSLEDTICDIITNHNKRALELGVNRRLGLMTNESSAYDHPSNLNVTYFTPESGGVWWQYCDEDEEEGWEPSRAKSGSELF